MKSLPVRELILLLLLLGLLGFAGAAEPKFLTIRSQMLLASHLWELALVAVPMLLIIMIGGIDLSIGAMVALCSVTLGLLFERGVSPWVGMIAALGVGAGLGFTNGWFVAKMRVHPLIVTVATMAAFRGVAEGVSSARAISGYPDPFLKLSTGKVVGIPYPLLIFAGVAFAAWFILSKMRFGRWIVAIGIEETVSRFSGIPVDRVKLILYTFSGLICGLAATLLVSRTNTAVANQGLGLELEAITAIVLGGASIEGGKGRVTGLVLGLLLIHQTREFVTWHWHKSELNLIVLGALLIGALLVERVVGGKGKEGNG